MDGLFKLCTYTCGGRLDKSCKASQVDADEMATKRRSAATNTEEVAPQTDDIKTTGSNGWIGDGNGSAVRGDTFIQKAFSSLGVVALIVLTPPFIIILCYSSSPAKSHVANEHNVRHDVLNRWYLHTQLGGDSMAMASIFMEKGFAGLWEIWPSPTPAAWRIIGSYAALEAFLQ
eukprot:4758831-Pyramimonas_sp.AAC.1